MLTLLDNLLDYIKPGDDSRRDLGIIKNMKLTTKTVLMATSLRDAEISKARRDINRRIRELTEEDNKFKVK
ncbi:DUF496 family protein [Vibrio chagasii]|nr:DUF496 family protein [Vibrio chagasii]